MKHCRFLKEQSVALHPENKKKTIERNRHIATSDSFTRFVGFTSDRKITSSTAQYPILKNLDLNTFYSGRIFPEKSFTYYPEQYFERI